MSLLNADDVNVRNTLQNPSAVIPRTSSVSAAGSYVSIDIKEKSFVVLQISCDGK
ncbi:MAG: hypothetical protein NC344_02205 [Bacteroidales bacterium]|nr:hypothetical protein [Bacteroidales bacterium]MCM1146645.1 hypothetical protein [Bacteroidales bacterium]MCM1511063.1 hypothetical protein [Clostridium sp.]